MGAVNIINYIINYQGFYIINYISFPIWFTFTYICQAQILKRKLRKHLFQALKFYPNIIATLAICFQHEIQSQSPAQKRLMFFSGTQHLFSNSVVLPQYSSASQRVLPIFINMLVSNFKIPNLTHTHINTLHLSTKINSFSQPAYKCVGLSLP